MILFSGCWLCFAVLGVFGNLVFSNFVWFVLIWCLGEFCGVCGWYKTEFWRNLLFCEFSLLGCGFGVFVDFGDLLLFLLA